MSEKKIKLEDTNLNEIISKDEGKSIALKKRITSKLDILNEGNIDLSHYPEYFQNTIHESEHKDDLMKWIGVFNVEHSKSRKEFQFHNLFIVSDFFSSCAITDGGYGGDEENSIKYHIDRLNNSEYQLMPGAQTINRQIREHFLPGRDSITHNELSPNDDFYHAILKSIMLMCDADNEIWARDIFAQLTGHGRYQDVGDGAGTQYLTSSIKEDEDDRKELIKSINFYKHHDHLNSYLDVNDGHWKVCARGFRHL